MKKVLKIISFLLTLMIVPLVLSCTKEKQSNPLIDTKWEVWSITAPERDFIIISPTPYLITFKKDNVYNMRLDVNSCGSTYKIYNENLIDIEPIYCTEICCDKPFADTLRNVLNIVKSYKITGDELELIATNRIVNLTKIKSN
jgi:hypothetical protein